MKTPSKPLPSPRLIMKTRDDCLIMDRTVNPKYADDYIDNRYGHLDLMLKIDARERGVKVISYSIDEKTQIINIIVDYL